MPDKDCERRESGVRVLTPDGDDARAVARAMASTTAGGILHSFQGQELTASDIANLLDLLITTIMYHIEALLQAGLIEVSRTRYSVKGREIKLYRQSDQVLIVASKEADLRSTLLKYASLFGMTIIGAGIASLLTRSVMPEKNVAIPLLFEAKEASLGYAVQKSPIPVASDMVTGGYSPIHEIPQQINPEILGIPDIVAGILIGGSLVIILLIFIDILARRRN